MVLCGAICASWCYLVLSGAIWGYLLLTGDIWWYLLLSGSNWYIRAVKSLSEGEDDLRTANGIHGLFGCLTDRIDHHDHLYSFLCSNDDL